MTDGPSPDVDNVLLLVIDALRVDRLGALSDDGGTSLTPNIDALADVSKARERIGYEPSKTIREGVSAFIDWYDRNHDWYEPLVRE